MQTIDCILLIDRDEISKYVSIRLIRKHKLSKTILSASGCREALELIRTTTLNSGKPPGLILMESNIRFELDAEYKELESFIESHKDQVQVIMLTNIVDHKDLAMVRSSGVNYILSKPLTEEKLMDVIRHFRSRSLSGQV